METDLSSVHEAVYTDSKYLAWAYHSALCSEFALAALMAQGRAKPQVPIAEVLTGVRDYLFPNASGYRELVDVLQYSREAAGIGTDA